MPDCIIFNFMPGLETVFSLKLLFLSLDVVNSVRFIDPFSDAMSTSTLYYPTLSFQ